MQSLVPADFATTSRQPARRPRSPVPPPAAGAGGDDDANGSHAARAGRPALGTAVTACNQFLGLPLRVVPHVGSILRQYLIAGQQLTLCFDRGVLVAVHVTYHPERWPFTAGGFRPRDFHAGLAAPRLLIGDTGWVIAQPDCPHRLIRTAAGLR